MNIKRLNINSDDLSVNKSGMRNIIGKLHEWYFTVLKKWPLSVIMDLKYDIENGIRNLILWTPTIWKDRNWDGYYILTILIKKIELQRECIMKNNIIHPDELKVMDDDMSRCLSLLKKVNDEWENYEKPFIDEHDKKWGKRNFEFAPVEGTNNFSMEIRNSRDLSDADKEQERKEYLDGMSNAGEQRKKDLKEAMNIIASHVDEWWD